MQDLKWFANYTKKSLDASDMKAIELNSEALDISPAQLMENAGSAVAQFVERKFARSKNVLVICGNGNNGGDGLVAARRLEKTHNVVVALLGSKQDVKAMPALANLHAIERSYCIRIEENASEKIESLLKNCDIVIDAVFGTGFHGKLPRQVEEIARKTAQKHVPVIAVDVPSGLDASTGKEANAFEATYTITFHKMKTGLLGSKKAGTVIVADIGIPIEAELSTGPGDLEAAARPRMLQSNKYANGRVLIIGGSKYFHGAPSLAANSAYNALSSLRIGAGYAVVLAPSEIIDIVRKASPNLIARSFGKETIGEGDLDSAKQEIEKSDAIAIGMGIGREPSTLRMTQQLIKHALALNKKIVIDADALYALHGAGLLNSNAAVTPQEKEFEELYGKKPEPENELSSRAKEAIELAKRLNANVILKGHTSIITDGKLLKLNTADTSALATMGTGDVLSGIIAGYAATGTEMFKACVAGAYLHAKAGDALALEKGRHILASDIIDAIPKIIKEYDKEVNA